MGPTTNRGGEYKLQHRMAKLSRDDLLSGKESFTAALCRVSTTRERVVIHEKPLARSHAVLFHLADSATEDSHDAASDFVVVGHQFVNRRSPSLSSLATN
ncbi:MAG: hypothetical protein NT013_22290 [Planctomycetia bacterium]|nr:hypothetical protein [Planctomycetia bacterium]